MKYDTRKIDAMVAEKVMGFTVRWMVHYGSQWTSHFDTYEQAQADADERCRIEPDALCYSTDPAAMMSVVEAVEALPNKWLLSISHRCGDMEPYDRIRWAADFRECKHDPSVRMRYACGADDSMPMAVCLAALLAVGVPESEIDKAKEMGNG